MVVSYQAGGLVGLFGIWLVVLCGWEPPPPRPGGVRQVLPALCPARGDGADRRARQRVGGRRLRRPAGGGRVVAG